MGVQIESAGNNTHGVIVNSDGQLSTNAETNLTGHYISLMDQRAFNTISIDPAAAANDYIFYFKNTSATRLFFVDLIRCEAVEAVRWKIATVTGTAGGTTITPQNLNLSSGITAEADAYGNAAVTGLTEANVIAVGRSQATGHIDIPFDDILILGQGDAIAVEYDTGTGGIAEVLMRGYYKDREKALAE